MAEAQPPIADEHLVAYLDGELEPAAREAVEAQLANDPDLRKRLAGFEQAWNLLDRLPRSEVSSQFAETTVSMAADRLDQRRSSAGPWLSWIAIALAGFLVVGVPMYVLRQRQVRDLPVIQNLELYRVAESVEFLQMLEQQGLFLEDVDEPTP